MEAVHIKRTESYIHTRAVAMSENLWGHIVLGEDNVPPLVEIGLTYLPKSGGARAPPPLATGLVSVYLPSISILILILSI